MTLLTYILSLALSFCLDNYDDACNIRSVDYYYNDVSDMGEGIDYTITEVLSFVGSDGVTSTRETIFDVPFLDDADIRDWKMCINLLAKARGVEIKSFNDASATGVISEERLESFKDIKDNGWINDVDSYQFATNDDLLRQQTKTIGQFCSFGLFYMSAKMLLQIFSYWTKPKKGV